MSTTYPTTKDSFTALACGDSRNPKDVVNVLQDATAAEQTKIGIDGDTNAASFDYKLSEVLTSTPDKAVGKVAAQILKNKKLEDTSTNFMDDLDNTKLMQFQLSGLTSNTTRTLTVPDASDTLGVLAAAQTFTNKTITDSTNLISFNSPDSFLINGRISVSVASNNITLSIVGMNGNTPSASNPVFVRINNTIRSIIASLSITKNAGTNWFNSGGTDLATAEIDYFVYLSWDSANSTIRIGFSRIPYARIYSDFSVTTTNERYAAFSTNPSAGDDVVVIGRFAATLSATASFNWSVPTFTTINLIQRPIFVSRILSYNPTYTASGSMTFTSVTNKYANYMINYNTCLLMNSCIGTTGNIASNSLNITAPFTSMHSTDDYIGAGAVTDATFGVGFVFISGSGSNVVVHRKSDNSNYALAANKRALHNFIIQI